MQKPESIDFHLESRPCLKCGAAMLHDKGEPWDGPTWACTGCGHSENDLPHAEPAKCIGPVQRESVADALMIVESFGPWGADLNDAHRRQIVLADEVRNLRAALQWYADGLHFDKAAPDAWDTVSGEPPNWWCDEAGTATVEDGSIAAMVLAGELTGEQVQSLE